MTTGKTIALTRRNAGCQTGNWALLARSLLSSYESKNVSFSNPPEKSFQGLNKSFHYHQFLSLALDFSEETFYMDLLTRTSSHGTPRFIEYSRAMSLMTQRSTSSHHFLRGKVHFVPGE